MLDRTRERIVLPWYTLNGGPPIRPFSIGLVKERIYDFKKKPGPCIHSKRTLCSGLWVKNAEGTYVVGDYPLYSGPGPLETRLTKEKLFISLNHSKLPTTNEFGFLQFFAELDQTLALFTTKFWKNLSYGSVTWGVLPFVSEMRKILEFVAKREKAQGKSIHRYEDEVSIQGVDEAASGYSGTICRQTFSKRLRYSGNISYPQSSQAQQFLDSLGFHPDLNVAWDLVPLSFMVDWFLPVGDYIKSLHASGWVREVYFSGYFTSYYYCDVQQTGHINVGNYSDKSGKCTETFSQFERKVMSGPLIFENPPQPTVDNIANKFIDSDDKMKHVFNTLYLLSQGRK